MDIRTVALAKRKVACQNMKRTIKMNPFQLLLAVGLVAVFADTAQAKANYKGKVQMIKTAEVMAVVEIARVRTMSVINGNTWSYRQMVSAKVEKVLKGDLPDNVTLYGDTCYLQNTTQPPTRFSPTAYICGKCHFEIGRYLVFLKRDGELLTGNNWQLSVRKISRDSQEKIEWFDGKKILENQEVLLSDVLSEVKLALSHDEPETPEKSRK
jgi:hypothetical protein